MSKSDATLESWEQKSFGGGKREMEWKEKCLSLCQKMHQMHRVTRDESKSLLSYLQYLVLNRMYCATLSRHLSKPALYNISFLLIT